jgi:hypothetical protein
MPRAYNVININGHIVPATKHDAIKKILQDLDTGRISAAAHATYRCKRRDGTSCMCAIGTFFTDEQLDHVASRRKLGGDTADLARVIGRENFHAMTGLEPGLARVIQSDFDHLSGLGCGARSLDEFADRMRKLLTTKNYPNPATEHSGAWHFPVSGE